MSKKSCEINLKIETEVLTTECAGQIVIAILESILFQRNQIPFVFQTFKYLVSQFRNNSDADKVNPFLNNLQINIEKDKARETLNSIKELSDIILNNIHNCSVSSVRLLIGSTVMTPKEAYIIKIPNLSKNHSNEYHKATIDPLIKKILLSLLTCDQLHNVFSKDIVPTNIYMELEMTSDSVDNASLFCKDYLDLPFNCQKTTINLNIIRPENFVDLECCNNINICNDLSSLSISSILEDTDDSNKSMLEWYEASTFIRGFRTKLIKGKNIWSSD